MARRTRAASAAASLSAVALDYLRGGLAGLRTVPSGRRYDRLLRRTAVTYIHRLRTIRTVPEAAVEYDDFRLACLSYRVSTAPWCRRRVPLALFRPVIDLPGAGRITFVLESVHDLAARGPADAGPGVRTLAPAAQPETAQLAAALAQAAEDVEPQDLLGPLPVPVFYWAFRADRPPVFEATHTAEQWHTAEIKIGAMRAWPASFFVRPPAARWATHPLDGSLDPWGDAAAAAGAGTATGEAHGSWVLRDGVPTPRCQEPAAVYVYLSEFAGRAARNPAFEVLRRHRIIPRNLGYRSWIDQLSKVTDQGRVFADTLEAGSPTSRLADALAAYLDRSPELRLGKLVAAVREAAAGFGLPVPDEETAADWLSEPWLPVGLPAVSRVQVMNLTGPPSPETMVFETPEVTADLYALGAAYEQVPATTLAELSHQRAREHRGPTWKRTGSIRSTL